MVLFLQVLSEFRRGFDWSLKTQTSGLLTFAQVKSFNLLVSMLLEVSVMIAIHLCDWLLT